jgi:nucleotide-binding universal stress UspA family protein
MFDTIIMGRRGVSRIKRWILGSVSAKLLREVSDETLFLID